MRIDVTVDTAALLLRLRNGERRLAYAAVNAINNTALRIQTAEQERVLREFVIRKVDFMRREAAILKPRASVRQGRPYAEIAVGQKARLLLSTFESGGERQPFTPGAKSVAVPLLGRPARPSISRSVPPAFTFAGMRLVATVHGNKRVRRPHARDISGPGTGGVERGYGMHGSPVPTFELQGVQWKGRNRTFLLPTTRRAPLGGVFQRIGPGRGDIREIYSFRRGLRISPRLRFVLTARAIADQWFREEMQKETVAALTWAGGAR